MLHVNLNFTLDCMIQVQCNGVLQQYLCMLKLKMVQKFCMKTHGNSLCSLFNPLVCSSYVYKSQLDLPGMIVSQTVMTSPPIQSTTNPVVLTQL